MLSALRTFLSTIPGVKLVSSTSTLDSTYQIIMVEKPDIVIADVDILDHNVYSTDVYLACMKEVHQISPNIQCIVLVNDYTQRGIALEAGVGAAFIKGELNEQLRKAILVKYA